ncbi:MAG: FABP family protein [bacterium]|nr:FABP family protein [bacterium]
MEPAIEASVSRLALLAGRWKGRGAGEYPTIESFEYEEDLRFDLDAGYPLIHYEQKTLLLPAREPSHWESGFIRPLEDGSIEISNSQESGRVEVLRGRLDAAGTKPDGFEIDFESVVLQHDPRLVATRRTWQLSGDTLRYVAYMATHTTPEPRQTRHLEAVLRRM